MFSFVLCLPAGLAGRQLHKCFKELTGLIIFCVVTGDYLLSIKFNSDHVPNSPFRIPVASSGEVDSSISTNEDDVCQVCGVDTSLYVSRHLLAALEMFLTSIDV